MARPSKKSTEKKQNKEPQPVPRKPCSKCTEMRKIEFDYFKSWNPIHADSRHTICKQCIKEMIDDNYTIESVSNVLRMIDRPFLMDKWEIAKEESTRRNLELFGMYMKLLGMNECKTMTWADSNFTVLKEPASIENTSNITEVIESNNASPELIVVDRKNEEDVLRMLGYDPFESENPSDKRHLYNKLVDFLDESTLEDSFKLPAVIEIVKSFNQIDKINSALSVITSDPKNLATNVGSIKSLIDAKEKMLKSVLALAKDNGISVNHNNNRSKGAGTLSGIIKQLQEKGIDSAEINIYDVETCEGMKQVADISNKSIFEQLMLNENDYVEMIKDQREMILQYEKKVTDLEEENRLLKIKLKQFDIDINE